MAPSPQDDGDGDGDDGDEQNEFDFGAYYCIVCDRAIVAAAAASSSSSSPAASTSNSPAPSPSLTHATTTTKLQRKHSTGAGGGVRRNKSSSKLHSQGHGHGHGHGHVRRGSSHTALSKLGPSTAIHTSTTSTVKGKGKERHTSGAGGDTAGGGSSVPLSAQDDPVDDATRSSVVTTGNDGDDSHDGVGTVYCSLECKQQDLQPRGNSTHARPPPPLPPPLLQSRSNYHIPPRPPPPRTTSSTHSHHSHATESSLSQLDFSNRRNSRGASYRPLPMQRVPSSDDGTGIGYPWVGSVGSVGSASGRIKSSDSLASLGEDSGNASASSSGDRIYARPPSALSGLRAMTPIASSQLSPPLISGSKLRPNAVPRHHSDQPKPTTFRTDSDDSSPVRQRLPETREERHARRREKEARRRERGKLSSPPAADSGAWAPQSVPASTGTLGLEELRLTSRSSSTSRPPLRSGSSASLALMGSSFNSSYGRSFDSRLGQLQQPQRSDSSISLSGLNATGTIVAPSEATAPSTTPSTYVASPSPMSTAGVGARSSTSTSSPARPPRSSLSIPHLGGTSPSSPSSQSSFSQSTAHSSYLSSSAGSHHHHQQKRGRTARNLTMTRSSSSLATAGDMNTSGHGSDTIHGARPPPPQRPSILHVGDTAAGVGAGRANSTPAAIRRPSIYQTAPTPRPPVSAPPPLQNPSLSYLAAETNAANNGDNGGPGLALTSQNRNFSWDSLGVKAYHVMDVDEIRQQQRQQQQQQLKRRVAGEDEREGELATTTATGQHSDDGTTTTTTTTSTTSTLAPKNRKKLFHFAHDDDAF